MSDDFEGREVNSTALVIRGLEGGLRAAMEIKPTTLHIGDKIYTLTESTVVGVSHNIDKDDDRLAQRVHIAKASTVAIVSAEFASESIGAQRLAEEQARGVERLPFDEEPDDDVEGEPEDLPSMAQLKIMQDSTIKEALALIPDIADRAVLGRVRRAELETHAGGGRKIVVKAIDDRMAELGGES